MLYAEFDVFSLFVSAKDPKLITKSLSIDIVLSCTSPLDNDGVVCVLLS